MMMMMMMMASHAKYGDRCKRGGVGAQMKLYPPVLFKILSVLEHTHSLP